MKKLNEQNASKPKNVIQDSILYQHNYFILFQFVLPLGFGRLKKKTQAENDALDVENLSTSLKKKC